MKVENSVDVLLYVGTCAGILQLSMGARPTRLHRLAESILGLLKSFKIRAQAKLAEHAIRKEDFQHNAHCTVKAWATIKSNALYSLLSNTEFCLKLSKIWCPRAYTIGGTRSLS
jgi:hypothetical protein